MISNRVAVYIRILEELLEAPEPVLVSVVFQNGQEVHGHIVGKIMLSAAQDENGLHTLFVMDHDIQAVALQPPSPFSREQLPQQVVTTMRGRLVFDVRDVSRCWVGESDHMPDTISDHCRTRPGDEVLNLMLGRHDS